MVFADYANDLQFLTRNAAKLSRKLGEFSGNVSVLRTIVYTSVIDEIMIILRNELDAAIIRSREYDISPFRERLESAFSNPALVKIERDKVNIEDQALRLVGNWAELGAGIDAARDSLGLGFLTPQDAALFWKERIYRPAREGLKIPRWFKKNLGFYKTAKKGERIPFDYRRYALEKYSKTIAARQAFWGAKAPYWLWLEYGNGGEASGAYPPVEGTHFVRTAEIQAKILIRESITEIISDFTDAISNEVEAFLKNPQNYQPGQELDRFVLRGTEFRIGVSPGGELSITSFGVNT